MLVITQPPTQAFLVELVLRPSPQTRVQARTTFLSQAWAITLYQVQIPVG